MPRALILKFGAIGDVIMAIPAVHALHASGYEIDWVCGAAVEPVLACYPWIRTIVADDRALLTGNTPAKLRSLLDLWRKIGRARYDLCATLYYDARYRLLTAPVRAGRKLLLSHERRDRKLLPGRHHTDEYARILLGLADDVRPTSLAPIPAEHLPPSPLRRMEERPRILLAPAGARNMLRDDALRRWPAESYVAVAQKLLERSREVVLIGGADDGWISPAFRELAVTDWIGGLSLPETLALMDASDVLVTHDTGPLHLGGITGVGIIGIFGPTDPRGRLPQRAAAVALWGGEGFACRPCYDGRNYAPCQSNECVRQVSPEMVLEEVETMLERRSAGQAIPPRIRTPESTVMEEAKQ